MVLRRMKAVDVHASVAVLRQHDPSQDKEDWIARLERDIADADKYPVVAVVDDVVVGYGRTLPFEPGADSPAGAAPDGYYLLGLVVDPEHRRRGLGRQLAEERLRWLATRRATAVSYFTDRHNRASQRLHEQLGFRRLAGRFWFPALPSDHTEILYGLSR